MSSTDDTTDELRELSDRDWLSEQYHGEGLSTYELDAGSDGGEQV